MSDDHSATTSTAGTVTVGGSATGVIERKGDVDWFAVELVEGRTYVIDLEGAGAGTGTLGDAMLWGLFDDAGVRVAKRSRDGGEGNDARMVFTATESGTHYIAARGQRKDDTGTYTVRVRDQDAGTQAPANTNTVRTPEQTAVQQPPQPPADPDATAAGAAGLGDLAGLGRRGAVRQDSVDGGDDGTDYYSFTLSERQAVTLSLFRQDANADLYLEDGEGTVLASSTEDGTRKDEVKATLDAGTYYVRVAAQEAGENAYTLRAKAADPVAVVPVAPESLPQQHASQQHASQQQQAPDTDATRAGATYLGDFGWSKRHGTVEDSVNGTADGTDYYRFTNKRPQGGDVQAQGSGRGRGSLPGGRQGQRAGVEHDRRDRERADQGLAAADARLVGCVQGLLSARRGAGGRGQRLHAFLVLHLEQDGLDPGASDQESACAEGARRRAGLRAGHVDPGRRHGRQLGGGGHLPPGRR